MSARSRTVLPGRPPRSSPTTPVPAMPVCTSRPWSRSDEAGGLVLLEPELGMGVQAPAVGHDLRGDVLEGGGFCMHGAGSNHGRRVWPFMVACCFETWGRGASHTWPLGKV